MTISNLKVEYKKNPLGIQEKKPTFSWNVETERPNWRQKSYQILVSDKVELLNQNQGNIWDSEMVQSSLMVNVVYEGAELEPETRYYWKVRVEDTNGAISDYSENAFFETAPAKDGFTGKWVGETDEREHHIYRKEFSLNKDIASARAYICGLGHFEMYLNGNRVSDYVLEPGWTNYDESCLYCTYDVTDMLKNGANALGIMLGDGMYHVPGKEGRYAYFPRSYGYTKFLLQLNVTYADGSRESIVSDESFKRAKSPVEYSCIYGGEEYNANLEQKGYSTADFVEDDSWEQAVCVEAPKGVLRPQKTNPLKVMQTYRPVEIKELKPGVYLYDFGKNFSGWVSMKLTTNGNCQGQRIKCKPGEILKADGSPDQKVTGKNYSWMYYLNEEKEQFYRPKFSYTGFRYVQVEGCVPAELADGQEEKPVMEALTGEFIYPEMEVMGEFSCSNELFNRIHGIITQAMLSNIKSIMTDCPHREKLGWLEETHLIGPSIMYNYDVHNLYEKIEQDMKESQRPEGLVPDICPEYVHGFEKWHEGYVDSPEWGSACIINPWYMYKKYGDSSIFVRYYDVMKKYVDYLTGKTHHYVLHHGLGDWLDIGPCVPHSQNTPVPVIATTVYYYDLSIMKWAATMLGKDKDAKEYEDLMAKVKEEFNLQFFDNQTYRYATGSQAAQAMSLLVGLVEKENEEKVLDYLVRDIKLRNFATTAGDVGHPFVMAALTKYGKSDVINEMMNITDAPGYGYQVKCGATTLTEEWDGPDPARPHGSQNHFMLGSGEEWFYAGLAGISAVRTDKPFDVLTIQPHFAKGVDEVKAWHMHPYGKVSVHWVRKEQEITVNVTLPANTTGVFVSEADKSTVEIGSGVHTFTINTTI